MLTVNTTFQPQMLKIQMTFWHSGLKLHITTEDILLTLNLINNKRNCIFLITCMSFRISLKTKLSRESCDTLYKTSYWILSVFYKLENIFLKISFLWAFQDHFLFYCVALLVVYRNVLNCNLVVVSLNSYLMAWVYIFVQKEIYGI